MKKILLLFISLLSVMATAQNKKPREILKGKVIADSVSVEDIIVFNTTSNIKAVTDVAGNFTLYARPADTLLFSSLTFREAMLVLTEEHFAAEKLLIKLDVNVNVLDEVIITPLTGLLGKDSRETKTLSLNSGLAINANAEYNVREYKYSDNYNTALPQTESQLQGISFVRIFKLLAGSKKKKKTDAGQLYLQKPGKTFTETVKERFTYHFFTETLKIPGAEIGLFLNYCDQGIASATLLDPNRELDLTEYLVQMSFEYLKLKK